jgi:hypothetical protein
MADLSQLKQAVCEALDRKSSVVNGATSLRVDLKFFDDGSLRKVALFAEHEFTIRGARKPDIDRYDMGGFTST